MKWLSNTLNQSAAHPARTLTLLFVLCLAVFLAMLPVPRADGMLIGSDGIGYYMYVRSLVIDGDLDFANEYARLWPEVDVATRRTPTGRVGNQYALGSGLLWSPFFLTAHAVILGLRRVGVAVEADGYGALYQAAVCLGSLVYGALGMGLVHATAVRFRPRTALAASVLIWFGTNLVYYLVVEPSMSHACSLFATAWLVYAWVRARPGFRVRDCLLIGLTGGLAGVVRQPDATLLALPLLDIALRRGAARIQLTRVTAVCAGFLVGFAPQMATWWVLNGGPLRSGYLLDPGQGFSWLTPRLTEVLFSTEHGLFLWHPVLLFALAGFAFWGRSDRRVATLAVAGILLQAYLIASWSSWSQGDAFGGRMFIGALPLFALGLAALLDWALDTRVARVAWALGVGLIAWNALFVVQYRLGFISMSGPYTLGQLTLGKLEMLTELWRRVAQRMAR